jgi:hypothetical protein
MAFDFSGLTSEQRMALEFYKMPHGYKLINSLYRIIPERLHLPRFKYGEVYFPYLSDDDERIANFSLSESLKAAGELAKVTREPCQRVLPLYRGIHSIDLEEASGGGELVLYDLSFSSTSKAINRAVYFAAAGGRCISSGGFILKIKDSDDRVTGFDYQRRGDEGEKEFLLQKNLKFTVINTDNKPKLYRHQIPESAVVLEIPIFKVRVSPMTDEEIDRQNRKKENAYEHAVRLFKEEQKKQHEIYDSIFKEEKVVDTVDIEKLFEWLRGQDPPVDFKDEDNVKVNIRFFLLEKGIENFSDEELDEIYADIMERCNGRKK